MSDELLNGFVCDNEQKANRTRQLLRGTENGRWNHDQGQAVVGRLLFEYGDYTTVAYNEMKDWLCSCWPDSRDVLMYMVTNLGSHTNFCTPDALGKLDSQNQITVNDAYNFSLVAFRKIAEQIPHSQVSVQPAGNCVIVLRRHITPLLMFLAGMTKEVPPIDGVTASELSTLCDKLSRYNQLSTFALGTNRNPAETLLQDAVKSYVHQTNNSLSNFYSIDWPMLPWPNVSLWAWEASAGAYASLIEQSNLSRDQKSRALNAAAEHAERELNARNDQEELNKGIVLKTFRNAARFLPT